MSKYQAVCYPQQIRCIYNDLSYSFWSEDADDKIVKPGLRGLQRIWNPNAERAELIQARSVFAVTIGELKQHARFNQ